MTSVSVKSWQQSDLYLNIFFTFNFTESKLGLRGLQLEMIGISHFVTSPTTITINCKICSEFPESETWMSADGDRGG